MKHPTSESILTVIRNFEKVLPMAKFQAQLDMGEPRVSCNDHTCGTIHCAGGWYMVGVMPNKSTQKKEVRYKDGVNVMETDLGFKKSHYDDLDSTIELWAEKNPDVWGNNRGGYIFNRPMAYISKTRHKGAQSLQDIVDHWKEVYARVKALEEHQEGEVNPVKKPKSHKPVPHPQEMYKVVEERIGVIKEKVKL